MKDSMQEWVGKNRPPRVQIQYDVQIGDAIELKELPFVVGIMANLSGKIKETSLNPLKQRKFVNIDADNFDDILSEVAPEVTVQYDTDPEASTSKPEDSGEPDNAKEENKDEGSEEGKDKTAAKGKSSGKSKSATASKASVNLVFRKMDDFNPGVFLEQVEPLKELYEARCRLRDLQTKMDTNVDLHEKIDAVAKDADLVKKIGDAAKNVKNPEDVPDIKAISGVEEILNLVLGKKPGAEEDKQKTEKETEEEQRMEESAIRTIAKFAQYISAGDDEEADVHSLISDRINLLEKALSTQLNSILHQKGFQEIESTWRGLSYLVNNTNTNDQLKLRVLNVSQNDIWQDMAKAVGPKFDQSALFKKVYEDEYGTYGGDPYSLLVGDFYFNAGTTHVETLRGVAGVAAAAHAPFLAAADPSMFGMETFADLSKPRDLSKIFESIDLAQWRALRDEEDARYLNLTMPRVLIRNLYGNDNPVEQFNFEEEVDGKDPAKYLWANPAFILAQRVTNAFYLYGWTAAIRGVEGGGLVENLPFHTFKTDDGDVALKCPTEIAITDRREKELTDLGFVAICHCKNTPKAAFFGSQSTKKPKFYSTNAANDNSRISAMLPYLLAASRFAHYIKVIMREKVGSFMTRANVEAYLNTWIVNYVLLDDNADQETKAKYPLREARIDVAEIPGKPGAYNAVVFLKPHFQLEELTTSIRLVAELPPPAG